MELLLPIEIHVAVCELQATHRSTIAGLLLQNCIIQVMLLRGLWNSGAALAGVQRGVDIGFGKQYSKSVVLIVLIVLSDSVVVLNEVVVMCVAIRRALLTVDTPSIKMAWRYFLEWPT